MSGPPYRDEREALRAENAALRGEIARLRGEQRRTRAATARYVLAWAVVAALDLVGGVAVRRLVNSERDGHVYAAAVIALAMALATGWQFVRTLRGPGSARRAGGSTAARPEE